MMKKIKVAVAGFGDRGYSLVVPLISGEFRSRAEIVAVLDNNSVKLDFARGVLKEFPGVQYFTSLEDFLKCDADLVLVTPPQFAHRDLACAALDAGFHIFLEKPMARNEKECKEIIAAEKRFDMNSHTSQRRLVTKMHTFALAGFIYYPLNYFSALQILL